MTLWIRIGINEGPKMHELLVHRVTNTSVSMFDASPDMVSKYEVTSISLAGVRDIRRSGTVMHRYGDGPLVLARKALELATAESTIPDRAGPWRKVASAELRSGRGGVLGPHTTRRPRWWVLGLACGHVAERAVRYRPLPVGERQHGGTQYRSRDDALPAPKRIRCAACLAASG